MVTWRGIFQDNKNKLVIIVLFTVVFVDCGSIFKKTPPGTTYIKSLELYVDKIEVSNMDWLSYLSDIRENFTIDSDEYRLALPDMNTWKLVYPNLDLINKLPAHSGEKDMPVVGISYEQVVSFCQWRSKKASKLMKRSIEYRLPTKQEWDLIAQHVFRSGKVVAQKEMIASPRTAKGKIEHLQDNVSELVTTGDVVKGLNYNILKTKTQDLRSSDIICEYDYTTALPYVGFRCVAIMK